MTYDDTHSGTDGIRTRVDETHLDFENSEARVSDLLRAAAERAVPLVEGTEDDALDRPTPCAEYDVRALLNHLYAVVVNFQALAAKEPADFSEIPDRTAAPGWREGFGVETGRLVEAWRPAICCARSAPGRSSTSSCGARRGSTRTCC
ncbi:maleylpyruvate isomerase N-terminal domain-containing protein, partial [Streptomyces hydrogenans]|uniref:maleylpyruvate isomerase N-terminal domain-containing protein n=1 Tax=Streptomyces hydrogenans TaxID=1873719 RepID=UPI0035D8F412